MSPSLLVAFGIFLAVAQPSDKASDTKAPAPAAQPTATGLSTENVLVVFDSRKPDSLAIAAYYAGSDAVGHGARATPGTRKGVHVFDLSTALGDKPLPEGTIDRGQYETFIRQPLIEHMSKAEYAQDIRVLVLTKGMPHRIADMQVGHTGDQPQLQAAAFEKGNATCASVDSELTLLWQDLAAGEKGGRGDSHADGLIINPYWRAPMPITTFSNKNVRSPKDFVSVVQGQFWYTDPPSTNPPSSAGGLTPGDIYLVCRLDGPSASDVISSLERAHSFTINTNTSCIVLDEADSNGVADKQPNRELDNIGPEFIWGGDDYEMSRDVLLADGRYRKDNIFYDSKGGPDNFCIGPRVNCKGKGRIVGGPVLLLATAGGNAAGLKLTTADGHEVSDLYPASFQYAPGAIFTSLESFNGREFGGMTGWPGQAQASGFIKAGGTFAICNAWEPFAFSLPDNVRIVGNFLLGNLTWAEAAYSAIPGISWQQIVIGDPLARPFRQCEDLNGDKMIDEKDLALFDRIATNKDDNGKPFDPMVVGRADINRDGAIDAKDRALIEKDIAANAFYRKQESGKTLGK